MKQSYITNASKLDVLFFILKLFLLLFQKIKNPPGVSSSGWAYPDNHSQDL